LKPRLHGDGKGCIPLANFDGDVPGNPQAWDVSREDLPAGRWGYQLDTGAGVTAALVPDLLNGSLPRGDRNLDGRSDSRQHLIYLDGLRRIGSDRKHGHRDRRRLSKGNR
jgi:hypothetical protein